MLFFKPIDLRDLTIVSHAKPIKSRRAKTDIFISFFFDEKKASLF